MIEGFEEVHAFDLLEQIWNGLVIEGKAAAEQRIQDDPTAPHIHLWAGVQLPRYDLSQSKMSGQCRGHTFQAHGRLETICFGFKTCSFGRIIRDLVGLDLLPTAASCKLDQGELHLRRGVIGRAA